MKIRILLLTFICLSIITPYSIGGYAQVTAKFTGDSVVCPKISYTYTFIANKVDTTKNLTVPIAVKGGVLVGKNSSTANFTLPKNQNNFTFQVQWDDKSINDGSITTNATSDINPFGFISKAGINVISMKGCSVSSLQGSPHLVKNNVVEIPYGQTGTLTLSTSASYPYPSGNQFAVSTFEWKFAGNTSRGSKTYQITYGASDLDGSTLSVTPIGTYCSDSYGNPTNIVIRRTLTADIIPAPGNCACENNIVSFSIEANVTGMTVNWETGNNMALVSGQGLTTATFKIISNGTGNVKADISYQGKVVKTISKDIGWLGKPKTPSIIYGYTLDGRYFDFVAGTELSQSSEYDFYTYAEGAQSYTWAFEVTSSNAILHTEYDYARIRTGYTGNTPLLFKLSTTANNVCGSSAKYIQTGYAALNGSLRSYDITGNNNIQDGSTQIKSIRIYSISGSLVYNKNFDGSQHLDLNALNLVNGIYIIETIDMNNNIKREKKMIKR